MRILPIERGEMRQRWRAAEPRPPVREPLRPRPRNVQPVLELGETVYIHFRGRQYGVPPVPYRAGAAILDAYLRVRACGEIVTRETLPEYRDAIAELAKLLRRRLRAGGGMFHRALFRLGFFNPLASATEADVLALAVFLSGRRTKSSGIELVANARPAPRTF